MVIYDLAARHMDLRRIFSKEPMKPLASGGEEGGFEHQLSLSRSWAVAKFEEGGAWRRLIYMSLGGLSRFFFLWGFLWLLWLWGLGNSAMYIKRPYT